MVSNIHIQALDKSLHDRASFDCGVSTLNDYLAKQAALDMKRKASGCWGITAQANSKTVLGYYTLSTEAIDSIDLPEMPILSLSSPCLFTGLEGHIFDQSIEEFA